MPGTSGPVDVAEACDVLARWDGRDDLDSRGALLFRRFAERVLDAAGRRLRRVPVLARPTRSTRRAACAPRTRAVRQALADAVQELRDLGLPLDAPLGDVQSEERGGERIPIHGGPGTAGVFNAINVQAADLKAGKGYETVPHGSSFVQAVQFVDGAVPGASRARSSPTRSRPTRVAVLRRPDADVLAQGVEPGAVLPRRRARADASRRRGSAPGGRACVARTALGRVSAKRLRRGRRMRVRWTGGGRATVDVLRGKRRVARLRGRGGRATWSGRGGRRDGVYVLRVRKAGDTRRLGVRRRGGTLRRLRPFERRARCALVRSLSLGAPTFRGG